MRDYVEGILLAERNAEIMKQHATLMTELANQDSLTGIRNKTAYDRTIRKMEYELDMGNLINFVKLYVLFFLIHQFSELVEMSLL